MAAILQTTFSNTFFLNENVQIPITILLKFVLNCQIKNIPAMVQIMTWRRLGNKPLSEPVMISLLTHIYVTRSHCITVHGCHLLQLNVIVFIFCHGAIQVGSAESHTPSVSWYHDGNLLNPIQRLVYLESIKRNEAQWIVQENICMQTLFIHLLCFFQMTVNLSEDMGWERVYGTYM